MCQPLSVKTIYHFSLSYDGALIKCKGTLGCGCIWCANQFKITTAVLNAGLEKLQHQTTWSYVTWLHVMCYEVWLVLTVHKIVPNCTTLCSTVPCSSLRSQFELCLWVQQFSCLINQSIAHTKYWSNSIKEINMCYCIIDWLPLTSSKGFRSRRLAWACACTFTYTYDMHKCR